METWLRANEKQCFGNGTLLKTNEAPCFGTRTLLKTKEEKKLGPEPPDGRSEGEQVQAGM